MNKMLALALTGGLMCTAALAMADDAMKSDAMHSKMSMDANNDGMVSKDEYMNYYQSQWDKMPKNKDGMVMMKDMNMMHHDKMMSGQGAMMEGKDMKDDKAKMDAVKPTDGH
jgi:hypothetical protein